MNKTFQKIMNLLMNSCKKTTALIDKQAISKLSFNEKAQLQLHKSMCKTCNAYADRSKFMDNAIGKLFNRTTPHKKAHLSEDRKSKILAKIKK